MAADWAETGSVVRRLSETCDITPVHEENGAKRILFPKRAVLFAFSGVCQWVLGLLSAAVVADSFVNGAK